MQYFLLNRDFDIIDGVEMFTSMIWTERYYEAGDFELYLPATKYSMDLWTNAAKEHYYIIREDDFNEESQSKMRCMIVENVKLDDTFDSGDYLIITGRSLKSLLNRRVVAGVKDISGGLEDEVRSLVEDNAISPKLTERVIPKLVFGESSGIDDFVNAQLKGGLLDDAITSLCKLKKVGWDIRLNYNKKQMEFIVYRGVDRSYAQTEDDEMERNPYVVFSEDFDNLLKTGYTFKTTDFRNVAYVYSEYKEQDPITKEEYDKEYSEYVISKKIDYRPSQLTRYETYVDGTNISTGQNRSETRLHLNELRLAMTYKGQAELDKLIYTTDMTGDVVPDLMYKINKDYFLGDLVTIKNEYDLRMESRVTEIIESWDTNKRSCIPTFTVENFTGKNEEEDNSTTNEVLRITEDEETSVRITDSGEGRKFALGWVFDSRAVVNPDGSIEERILEDSSDSRICTDIEATEKNKEVK